MRRLRLPVSIFMVSLATLMLELVLTRVFDVILNENMAYMIISCALFAFGLAGVYVALRGLPPAGRERRHLATVAVLIGATQLALLPLLNLLPFDFDRVTAQPFQQALAFLAMYLVLILPFFFAGLLCSTIFSIRAARIRSLYAWDLTGAALGCIVLIPLLPRIGPGGLVWVGGALGLGAAALLAPARRWGAGLAAAALLCLAVALLAPPGALEFREHTSKRRVREARRAGRVEFSRWDPVSKIDVIDMTRRDPATGAVRPRTARKHIAYDGGTQSSHFCRFDGDYARLRAHLPELADRHFWSRAVLAAHYLKEGSAPRVFIIGCAGGQEATAALLFGASQVDGVELVRAVVELGRGRYAAYTGGVLTDPRVTVRAGEGRSVLRSRPERYDIIQIFSNHHSSSIASGNGALDAAYLQTVEAYATYFERLTDDGILQVNHHFYPRMIVTAAAAWRRLGRDDFKRHVLVFEHDGLDNLPTLLIKMQPWQPHEVEKLAAFFTAPWPGDRWRYTLVEDPLDQEASFMAPAFYAGALDPALAARVPYRIAPATDDRPFFNFVRRSRRRLAAGREPAVNPSTALLLNGQLRTRLDLPIEQLHLMVVGAVSIVYLGIFLLLVRRCAGGGADWPGRLPALVYFACLGGGFIFFELLLIQVFRRFIGAPLYTYSLVIFTLLLGAGLGSQGSRRLGVGLARRWWLPFAGVVGLGLVAWATCGPVFDRWVAAPLAVRCLISVALLLPLGCFLGMPFPLGVLALRGRPRSAVAWAWAANGLATVAGGLLCMVMALALGFRSGLLVGVALYVLAGVMLACLRRQGSGELGEPDVKIGSEASKTLVGENPAVYDPASVGS